MGNILKINEVELGDSKTFCLLNDYGVNFNPYENKKNNSSIFCIQFLFCSK